MSPSPVHKNIDSTSGFWQVRIANLCMLYAFIHAPLQSRRAGCATATLVEKSAYGPFLAGWVRFGRPQAQSTQVIARSARLPCSLRLTPPPAFLPRSGRQAPSPPLATLPGGGGHCSPCYARPSASPRMSLTRIAVGGSAPSYTSPRAPEGLSKQCEPPRMLRGGSLNAGAALWAAGIC